MKSPVNTNSLGIGNSISSTTFINPYRYGFNGKEKDDEVKGAGNSYDFGERILDPRLGRWLSIDPKVSKYPAFSPYNFAVNSPISFVDPDGGDIKPANDKAAEQFGKVFKAFDSRGTDDKKISGGDLFGVKGYNVGFDKAPNQLVLGTSLTQKQFDKNLKKSGLSDAQKKDAKAIFKVLSADAIYEVGTVDVASKITNGNDGQSQKNKFVTENDNANNLLNKTAKGDLSNQEVQGELQKQENSGTTATGGAYGVFPDLQKTTGKDLKGAILINTQPGSVPKFSGGGEGGSQNTETKTIIQGIQGASEKIPDK